MKTAISLPDSLFEAAERVARHLGLSRSQLYQLAIKEFLQNHNDEAITEHLNQVYGDADRSPLDPVLDHLQQTSLDREDW